MLGEKIGEGTGKIISQRVLPGHKMEISARGTGKMLGVDTQDNTTYEATMLPDGTLQGEGRSILMGANGESATSTATGVGTIKPNGDVSWRGAFYFRSASKTLSRLNGTCVVFEAEISASGDSKISFYEWR